MAGNGHVRARGGAEARSRFFNTPERSVLQKQQLWDRPLTNSVGKRPAFRGIAQGTRNALTATMDHDHLVSERVIRAAIDVHRALGPGLLEGPYLACMCVELAHQGIPFDRERRFPLEYRGVRVADYIPDLIVAGTVVVEVKSVHHLEPVFTAQVITYLRITKLRVGLILNFNAPKLIDGLKRVVLSSPNPAPGTEP